MVSKSTGSPWFNRFGPPSPLPPPPPLAV